MKRAFVHHLVNTGRIGEQALWSVRQDEWASHEPIGRLALLHGLLTGRDIDRILNRQKTDRDYFGGIAKHMGLMNEAQLGVLLTGQGIRACVELLEKLALTRQVDLTEGLAALSEFASSGQFARALQANPAKAT